MGNNYSVKMSVRSRNVGEKDYTEDSYEYPCRYSKKGEDFLCRFESEGIRTSLKYHDHIFTVKREGDIDSVMKFDPEELTPCRYGTPQGYMYFDINTSILMVNEYESSMEVKLSYELKSDGAVLGTYKMTINILPAE